MSSPIYLSRLVPNIRSREARRDMADCVAMHRTLMNAFPDGLSSNGAARSEAGLLYRVEATADGAIALLVQSALPPEWTHLPPSWLQPASEPQVKEITEALGRIDSGSVLRFKLVANPTRKIGTKSGADGRKNNGKRVELRGADHLQSKSRLPGLAFKPGEPFLLASQFHPFAIVLAAVCAGFGADLACRVGHEFEAEHASRVNSAEGLGDLFHLGLRSWLQPGRRQVRPLRWQHGLD